MNPEAFGAAGGVFRGLTEAGRTPAMAIARARRGGALPSLLPGVLATP